MYEIESFLTELLGSYSKKTMPVNGKYIYNTSYSLPLYNYPTIDLVIISPYVFHVHINDYLLSDENCFYLFLYDKETDLIIGDIVNILYDWDWKDEITYHSSIYEHRINENVCPCCDFWLVQRVNKHGHYFLGCSGFPDCTYSKEITIF